MYTLGELQRAWAAAVLSGESGELAGAIRPGPLPADRRLQIYRNNHVVGIENALAAEFPTVKAVVGDAFFALLARRYVADAPLRRGSLDGYGAGFADLVSRVPEAGHLPYLADVARLDRARVEAYQSPSAGVLDRAGLAQLAPDTYGSLIFCLHPSCRLVVSPYPLLKIWRISQPDHHGSEQVSLDEGGAAVLVVRPAERVFMLELSPGGRCFVEALLRRQAFQHACDAAVSSERTCDVAQLLQQLVVDGIVTGFELLTAI